jgi:hypothetical protein
MSDLESKLKNFLEELYYENWYSFRMKWVNPWYYPIRDWIFPHNELKIRNIPRSWSDRDERLFHAVFSILCDFVEKEHRDGINSLKEHIVEMESLLEKNPELAGQLERTRETVALYEWYTSVGKSDPNFWDQVPDEDIVKHEVFLQVHRKEQQWLALQDTMLKRCIDNRHCWWT